MSDTIARCKLENNPSTLPKMAPKIGPIYGMTLATPVTSPTKMANG